MPKMEDKVGGGGGGGGGGGCPVSTSGDWDCAVCCELLYKPVVPPCGHPFCFWCAHRSMSYTSVSKCPLCRSEFTHLPRVSEVLHTLLSTSFPKEYEERAKDTIEFEREEEIESMSATFNDDKTGANTNEPSATQDDGCHQERCSNTNEKGNGNTSVLTETSQDMDFEASSSKEEANHNTNGIQSTQQDVMRHNPQSSLEENHHHLAGAGSTNMTFKCDNCKGPLFQPAIVTPCSHCLCGLCSGMYVREDEVEQEEEEIETSPIKTCPVCEGRLVAPPSVCHVLSNYLTQKNGPLEKTLKLKRKRQAVGWNGMKSTKCATGGRREMMNDGAQDMMDRDTGRVADAEGENNHVASISGRQTVVEPNQNNGFGTPPNAGNNSDVSAMEFEAEAGEAGAGVEVMNLQERIIRILKSNCCDMSPENFVHFGVGCDGCGVCPIVGPRYKCTECEERIGFDLCAECHLNHKGPGRFNQQHKPDHKMVLVEAKETLLHNLLKNHPGFTAEYLIELLNGMHGP